MFLLILPKLSLFFSEVPSIWDDNFRVSLVSAVGQNFQKVPLYYGATQEHHYHVFDWYIPGVIFRTTELSAQSAWFIHNIVRYVTAYYLFLIVSLTFFGRMLPRLFFLVNLTLVGGFDFLIYRLTGVPESHYEWWSRVFGLTSMYQSQISSFYTTFLWVPHHLLAVLIVFFVLLLLQKREMVGNKALIAFLIGGLYGISIFIFLFFATSYAISEIILLVRSKNFIRGLKLLLLQAIVASLVILQPFSDYFTSNPDAPIRWNTVRYFSFVPDLLATGTLWGDLTHNVVSLINWVTTYLFLYLLDIGLAAVLVLLYLSSGGRKRHFTQSFETYLLCMIATPIMILTFFHTQGANDLFMRGHLIGQIGIILLAASFLERARISLFGLGVISVLLLLQTTHTVFEFKSKVPQNFFPHNAGLFAMNKLLPKDAVLITDGRYSCNEIAYKMNRICESGEHLQEIMNKYEKVYFLSGSKMSEMDERLIAEAEGGFLYMYK